MSEKRYCSKETARTIFGDELSYNQGKKDMLAWLEKYCKEHSFFTVPELLAAARLQAEAGK